MVSEIQRPFQVAEPVAEAEPAPEPVAEAEPVAETEVDPSLRPKPSRSPSQNPSRKRGRARRRGEPVAETEAEPVTEPEPAADVAPLLDATVAEMHDDAPELEAKLGETPGAPSLDAEEPAAPADAFEASASHAYHRRRHVRRADRAMHPRLLTPATIPARLPAPSYDMWAADPVPPTFEPELAEVSGARVGSAETAGARSRSG